MRWEAPARCFCGKTIQPFETVFRVNGRLIAGGCVQKLGNEMYAAVERSLPHL